MRWPSRSTTALRRLYGSDKAKAIAFLNKDPVNSVLARANIDRMGIGPSSALVHLQPGTRDINALAWDGGNLIPLGFDRDGLESLADTVLGHGKLAGSLVGPADQVLNLWDLLEYPWGPAREVRPRQYSMVIDHPPLLEPDPAVRPARPAEDGLVLPASVAMFTEEVGYDPTTFGGSYAGRASRLIRNGMTYVVMGPALDRPGSRVVFKADVGALAGGVAQIQGVWVAPDQRNCGIGGAAMAAVVDQVRATFSPTVSLYVNDYNEAAVKVYQRVGFRIVDEWATVLL
ncbi:MAG: GNAT family N-acetyltransferase [Ancrocorticia sp.]|uniref:GNAT family N-acetyltransferase n=1 Tax=Ancrocorticia sp. TaxID=2593684 RepID=UPI003F930025